MSDFHPLEVVQCDSETEFQVGEKLNSITWWFNLYSAEIGFGCQNLTSVDFRF